MNKVDLFYLAEIEPHSALPLFAQAHFHEVEAIIEFLHVISVSPAASEPDPTLVGFFFYLKMVQMSGYGSLR